MDKKRVAIHGVPRSGTTWLAEIINSSPHVRYKYQPLFSYELKNYLNEQSGEAEIKDFFCKLDEINAPFLDQEEGRKQGIVPVFSKGDITHIVYKEVRYHHIIRNMLVGDPGLKVVGIIRSPLATLNSWIKSPREFRKDLGWDELEEWRFAEKRNNNKPEEFFGFEKWKEVALLFHELEAIYPDNFYLVTYDQLLHHTMAEVRKLFSFIELDISGQTLGFIDRSRNTDINTTYSVFKKRDDDEAWKHTLHPHIIEEVVRDLKNTELEKYL